MLKSFEFFKKPNVKASYFPICFTAFKALTFFVPLLLINILVPQDYVILESGLAISNILVIALNLGVSAAIPLYILKEDKSSDVPYIYIHCILASVAMLVFSLLSQLYFDSTKLTFICITVSILCNLRVISAHKKSLALPIQASFFETYLFVVLLICVVIGKVIGVLHLFHVNLVLFIASLFLISVSAKQLLYGSENKLKFNPSKFKELYSFSGAALFVGITIVSLVSIIRALGDDFLTTEEYLSYSVYFRLSSVAIIAFQFILTLKFKDIYDSSQDYLDKSSTVITVSVLIIALGVYASNFIIIPLFFSDEVQTILSNNSSVVVPIVLAMPLWAASAIMENIISRERAFKGMLFYLVGLSFIFFSVVAFLYFNDELNFLRIMYFHVVLLCFLVISQLLALYKLDIKLIRISSLVIVHLILGVLGASLSS
jgi:hypothetical protein